MNGVAVLPVTPVSISGTGRNKLSGLLCLVAALAQNAGIDRDRNPTPVTRLDMVNFEVGPTRAHKLALLADVMRRLPFKIVPPSAFHFSHILAEDRLDLLVTEVVSTLRAHIVPPEFQSSLS